MSKMRQDFTWTDVYDTHLNRMKAKGASCTEIAEFVNHTVSLANETDGHNIALITAQDVRDRYEHLRRPHSPNAVSAKTTVKHAIASNCRETIAVSLHLVQIRA